MDSMQVMATERRSAGIIVVNRQGPLQHQWHKWLNWVDDDLVSITVSELYQEDQKSHAHVRSNVHHRRLGLHAPVDDNSCTL